jgi:two-component system, NtrC family, sensor histidine kinase PilS
MTSSLPENESVSHQSTVHRLLVNQLLWMLFLRVVLYTLLLGVSAFLQSGQFNVVVLPPTLLFFFILLVYTTSITSSLILLKTNINPRSFGIKQILLDTVFISFLLYYTGGSHSIFSPTYFFPIIAGGLILPRLGGLIAAGSATLQYAFVLLLEYYQIFPDFLNIPFYDNGQDELAVLNLFAVYGLTFFLAATLSSLFAGRLRKTEDALSDSVRDFDRLSLLYKQIFDDISTGIVTTNDQNHITSVNNAAAQITGYSIDELLNKEFHKIFQHVSFTNKGSRHSAELRRKDGERTRIGYSYSKLQYRQLPKKDPAGNTSNSLCENCRVITIQDISEVERLEKQMQQAEKLAAIGRISAGIAHDFRNPLTAISGSAQVLADELNQMHSPQHQANSELITIILRESNRLSNTVSDFLKFARPEHAENEWFSLRRCLDEVLEVAQVAPSWPADCILDIQTDAIVDIWADQYQLFTILNHLLQNALAFTPLGEEKIRIKAEEIRGNEEADTIRITVEDNGPGVPAGKEEKIFEPFYTRRIDGTGLGLAIVKQMIKQHHGSIEVGKSSLGGAKFTICFPLP